MLLVRYLAGRQWMRVALWTLSYVLVSDFVIPTGPLSRLSGFDVWAWYFRGAFFLYGELLLVALLMFEYHTLAGRQRRAVS